MSTRAELGRALDKRQAQLLLKDLQRLRRQLSRAGQGFDVDRFHRDLAQAEQAAEQWRAARPRQIEYPESLPVSARREDIGRALREHPVIVLCGETGSGKTTQLPKIALDAALGARGTGGLIGHTQPRRLAARSVANRIAQELGSSLGGLVGYETRFDRRVGPQTRIKLMTDGILLAELQRDPELLAYDTVILDEAHERSLNIDFLLGWFKRLLPRRPDLRLIVTSATLDPERLSRHFDGAPILLVEGRSYPVETRWRPPAPDQDLEEAVAAAVAECWQGPPGDVLVFLPGEREIRELQKLLQGRFPRAEVLPLYSRLANEQQDRVFSRGGAPRIVLATNVAETSLTVPGIRYVVDVGSARLNRYSPRLGVQQLQIERVSQAAANQRQGRCGRVGPGVCIRLYDEADFATRSPYTDPEIRRSNLAGVILQMAALGLGRVDEFPWVDAPESRHVNEGYRVLELLGALDGERRLTALGRELARLPLDPRIARMVLAARDGPVADLVCVIAAALSIQDPHEVPAEAPEAARQKHAEWRHPRSDFLSYWQLWQRWQQWSATHSNSALRKLCRQHHLSYLRMEEWEAVVGQIRDLLGGREASAGARTARGRAAPAAATAATVPDELYAPIHRALAAGLIDHIGLRLPAEKGKPTEFQGPKGRRFRVFPGSTLSKKPPEWLLCAQLAQTSQLFARVCAVVEPGWLAEVGAHLLKRSSSHPEWNGERGEVGCTEVLSLFGLVLEKKRRHYGSIDPAAARTIFIREALVRGDWPNKPEFLKRNLALIAEIQDREARLRRPDLLVDEDRLHAFYDQRVPETVCTTAGLKAALKLQQTEAQQKNAGLLGQALQQASLTRIPGARLLMSEADVLREGAQADIASLFPDQLEIAGQRLRLHYTHDPSAEADGVSFHIRLHQLHALPPEPFEWLVPGLRPALLEALIRSLPQGLRRYCTPAATYAEALNTRLDPARDGALLPALCAQMKTMTGLALSPADFAPSRLEAHLRPRLVLEDGQGRVIDQGERLEPLQARHAETARAALARDGRGHPQAARYLREPVVDWDFGELPVSLELRRGVLAYPALEATASGVRLRLFESAAAARGAHRLGVRALYLARNGETLRGLARRLQSALGLALVGLPHNPERLAREAAERALERAHDLGALTTQAAFQAALMQRGEFAREAQARLDALTEALRQYAELRRRLQALQGRWPDSLEDLRQHLESLLPVDAAAVIPEPQWARLPVYLKALTLRLERLPQKPQRDADLTSQLRRLVPAPLPWSHPARPLLEEWRITLFAQELRAEGQPSPARLQALLGA